MASNVDEKRHLRCSFCGKSQDQVKKLIAGPNVYICNECIELCYDILGDDFNEFDVTDDKIKMLKPKEITEILDQFVISQDNAKKTLSVAVYNHYKRIREINSNDDIEVQKSNVLLVGPTGVGKTYIAQTLAKVLNVPFAIADATSLTEAGYVGEDVENILLKLIQDADFDVEKAERGIIYIDEIDKISRRGDNPSITRDVSGEGVQQALLKILEGTIASVPPSGGRKHPHQDFIQIDTTNILFICGGAFDGIDDIIGQRLNKKLIGFDSIKDNDSSKMDDKIVKQLLPSDLQKYGLIPEFVGRLPVLVTLEHLDKNALVSILTEPKNAIIKQYEKLFEFEDVYLEFENDALTSIAELAIDRKTGARGLRSIIESFMTDIMYYVPSDNTIEKIIITKDTVLNKADPKIIYNKNRKPIVSKKNVSKTEKKFSAG